MGLHPSWHPDRLYFPSAEAHPVNLLVRATILFWSIKVKAILNFWVVKSKMTSALNISLWMLFCGLGVCTSALQLVLKTLNIREYSGSGVKTHCDHHTFELQQLKRIFQPLVSQWKGSMSSANRVDLTSWEARYQWGQWETREDAVGYAMAYQLRYWLFLLHCQTLPPFPLLQMVISVDLVVLLFLIPF